jgi:pseudaminic acid synthase
MSSKLKNIFSNNSSQTYIIAEMSANHNGSKEIAFETIKAAKEIGANAVKLQTYTADTLTLKSNKQDFVVSGGTIWDGITLHELYNKAYTPWEWHKELFEFANKIGIEIFSSPFDKTAVDFLEKFNPSAYKIASFEITDYELVRYTASKGKPIIISTGIGTFEEINDVVDICRKVGNNDIILLKCTSAYPAPLEDANLRTIKDLEKTFEVIAGFSDHTLGATAPIAAVSLGAKVIEKHFILDKSIGGPDADFSLDKKEFSNMINQIRDTEKLLGIVDYDMTEKKKKNRRFSRSLYVSKDIKVGEKITEENVRSVRPGYGLHPKYFKDIIGKKVIKNLEMGSRVNMEDIDMSKKIKNSK